MNGLDDLDPDIGSRPNPVTEAHLSELIEKGTEAFHRNDFDAALRYIDRVWRYSPQNYLIAELLGQLLVKQHQDAAARQHLEALTERWPSPAAEASLLGIYLRQNALEAANARLEDVLCRFCVCPEGPLATIADEVLIANPAPQYAWIGFDPALHIVGTTKGLPRDRPVQVIDGRGELVLSFMPTSRREILSGFRVHVPSADSARGALSIWFEGRRIGRPLSHPPLFGLDGRARIVDGEIIGWASLDWMPNRALDFVAEDEKGSRYILSTQRDSAFPFRWRFACNPRTCGLSGNLITISVARPDGIRAPLPDAPLLLELPPPPSASRRSRRISSARTPDRRIDVVVPVYRGLEETRSCLEAVLATTDDRAELIVIEDASPEPDLVAYICGLSRAGRITLLRNEVNLGFPASCNRAIELHRDRDIVLLNADTVVYGDWLDRLTDIAQSSADIGTVTPLSNAGSVVSYPGGEEQACDSRSAAELDQLARAIHRGPLLDLPVGVGFCLYLRRDCLTEIGLFDAQVFSFGYGEEVDFCLRAARRGWRHVLAPNIFVRHAGGRSFGKRRLALLDRSAAILDRRYPYFQGLIENFHSANPLQPIRRSLDEARLGTTGKPIVLLLSLSLPGGVERFVQERCRVLMAEGRFPVVLKPDGCGQEYCRLETPLTTCADLRYDLAHELEHLMRFLARLKLESIEFHHFLNLDRALIDALYDLGAAVDIYIHDYSWICPRITLIDSSRRYCGEPGLAQCERCVSQGGSQITNPPTVSALRKQSDHWLSRSRNVFVPSHDVYRRLVRYFPQVKPQIIPWELKTESDFNPPRSARSFLRVGLIGAIGIHKGYEVLLACARDAMSRSLPIEFVVLGYTENDDELCATGKVFVTGVYDDNELPLLLQREAPDIVLFVSVWPETWCYALSSALAARLPIVAFDLGAMRERLQDYENGTLIPLTNDPVKLNDLLLNKSKQSGNRNSVHCSESRFVGSASEPRKERQKRKSDVKESRSELMPALNTISATVQILPLTDGLYSFSVKEGLPGRAAALDNLLLPAVHVGPGPGEASEHIELIAAPKTHGAWLCQVGDIVIVRILKPTTILLTSLQSTTGQALSIDVERLDNKKLALSGSKNEVPERPAVSAPVEAHTIYDNTVAEPDVSVELKLHIRNQGDASFLDGEWAGRTGAGKWIEAFSIVPKTKLEATDIEYKALTATGLETPWLTNGATCGTRGQAIPLLGFAVRLAKSHPARQFECEYTGYFSSGTIVGPFKGGTPCRSSLKNDPLEGLRVRIVEQKTPATAELQQQHAAPSGTPVIGPRFSKLREAEHAKNASKDQSPRPTREIASEQQVTQEPLQGFIPRTDERKAHTPSPDKRSSIFEESAVHNSPAVRAARIAGQQTKDAQRPGRSRMGSNKKQ